MTHMPTRLEAAMRRAELLLTPIPAMTSELGKYWEQPNRFKIRIEGRIAYMSQASFDQLLDYTASEPTGAYAGKIWRAQYQSGWFLLWFGEEFDAKDHRGRPETRCARHHAKIQITEANA